VAEHGDLAFFPPQEDVQVERSRPVAEVSGAAAGRLGFVQQGEEVAKGAFCRDLDNGIEKERLMRDVERVCLVQLADGEDADTSELQVAEGLSK
jgi:hypothetical protein